MNMVTSNVDRIGKEAAASREAETRRREQLLVHLSYYAANQGEIGDRLRQLDDEWDVDRVLTLNGSAISLFGVLVGLLGRKRWYVIAMIVQALMIQHEAQRCSAAGSLLRSLGFRTKEEIEQERYALKLLRGDLAPALEGGQGGKAGDPDALALKVLRATSEPLEGRPAPKSGGRSGVRSPGP